MANKTDDSKRKPLTEQELGEYLLWRFILGGYDHDIAGWRAERDKAAKATAGDDPQQP